MRKVEGEIANLVRAIQGGGPSFGSVQEALAHCENRKRALRDEAANLEKSVSKEQSVVNQTEIEAYLAKFREVLLDGPVPVVREELKKHIAKIMVFPDGRLLLTPKMDGILSSIGTVGAVDVTLSQQASRANAPRYLVDFFQTRSKR